MPHQILPFVKRPAAIVRDFSHSTAAKRNGARSCSALLGVVTFQGYYYFSASVSFFQIPAGVNAKDPKSKTYVPATVKPSTTIVGEASALRNCRSDPIIAIWFSISGRVPAMVTSCTG
jgi:hypothetical protein